MKKKLAILDDYKSAVREYAAWSASGDRVDITVFRDAIHDLDTLVASGDAVQIEDKTLPNRCGRLSRRTLAPLHAMQSSRSMPNGRFP